MADKITFNPTTGKFDVTANTSGLLKLDQTTPQTIVNGIPVLTGLTPTTDYQIATKKYVDDNAGGTTDDSDIAITRSGSEITRLDWESSKSAVLNRTDGVLTSVVITYPDESELTKTLVRDESGALTGVLKEWS